MCLNYLEIENSQPCSSPPRQEQAIDVKQQFVPQQQQQQQRPAILQLPPPPPFLFPANKDVVVQNEPFELPPVPQIPMESSSNVVSKTHPPVVITKMEDKTDTFLTPITIDPPPITSMN